VPLRAPQQGSRVLLFVRDAALGGARSYISALEARVEELREWYGSALLVTERAVPETTIPRARAAADAWAALGIPEGESALIIADRWGDVYSAQHSRSFGDLPSTDQIEEWIRFLAMQCPECGVIDEPGYGEWTP
jgi:hypothetical protein